MCGNLLICLTLVTCKEVTNKYSFYLQNNKTGNIYVDSHVDGRLYGIDREERPYELMYISSNDCVYVGIHARNTKRLPFDMTVSIGYETIGQGAAASSRTNV